MGLIGMLIASALGDRVGAVGWLDSSGCLNILTGIVAIVLLRGATLHAGQTSADRKPAAPLMGMREIGESGDLETASVSIGHVGAFKKV
jgi:hypothetical protein